MRLAGVIAAALALATALPGACTYEYDAATRCNNGKKDSGEADVDCGGTCLEGAKSRPCALSSTCGEDRDCAESRGARCFAGRCEAVDVFGRWQRLSVWDPAKMNGPSPRRGARFSTQDGVALLVGGWAEDPVTETVQRLSNEAWLFKLGSDDWGLRDARPAFERHYHGQADDPLSERTFLVGGCRGAADASTAVCTEPLADVRARDWSRQGETWETLSALPGPRSAFGMAFDATRNTLVVTGGVADGVSAKRGEVLELAVGTGAGSATWKIVSPGGDGPPVVDAPLVYHAASNKFIVFGGSEDPAGREGTAETWTYDPSTRAWTNETDRTGATPGPRWGQAMAYDPVRKRTVMTIGRNDLTNGANPDEDSLNDTWEYDGTLWRQLRIEGKVPPKSFDGSMTWDPKGQRMLLFVGASSFQNDGYLASIWELKVLGGPCAEDASCGSDATCVDLVCCVASSCDSGEACNAPESPGECVSESGAGGAP